MKKHILLTVAALALAAGCSKELEAPVDPATLGSQVVTFTAEKQATRVGFENDKTMYWEEGDEIYVLVRPENSFDRYEQYGIRVDKKDAGKTTASFSLEIPEGYVVDRMALMGFSYWIWHDGYELHSNCWIDGNPQMAMVAKIDQPVKQGDNAKLAFTHVAGAFKFSFKGFPKEAHYLKLTAYGKQIRGDFPPMDEDYFSAGSEVEWVLSTSDCGDEETIDDRNCQYIWIDNDGSRDRSVIVPVPIGEYPKVKVELLDWYDGKVLWSRTTTRTNTIGRGQIAVMPEVEIPGLKLAGVFNDWDPANGPAFSDVEGHDGWQAAKGVALKAGEGFKITKYGSWVYSVGATGTDEGKDYLTIATRQESDTSTADGAPNFAMDADGTYDIYYHDGVHTLVVYPAGEEFASEAVEGWNIWANFEEGDTWKTIRMQDQELTYYESDGDLYPITLRVAKNVKVQKDGAPFIFNFNGKFDRKYGFKESRNIPLNRLVNLADGGEDIYIEKAGEYDFYFIGAFAIVLPAGTDLMIAEVCIRGSFDGWGQGVPMVYDYSNEDDPCYIASGLELGDNVEFNLEVLEGEAIDYCPAEDEVLAVGSIYPADQIVQAFYYQDYFYNSLEVTPFRYATVAGKKYDIIYNNAGIMVVETGQRPQKTKGWSLIGIGGKWGWYDDIPMEDKVVNDRTWRFVGNVSCAADDEFKFRKSGWGESAGWKELQQDGKGYPITVGEFTQFDGDCNVRIAEAGSYDFYFDPETRFGAVVAAGSALPAEVPHAHTVYVLDETRYNEVYEIELTDQTDQYLYRTYWQNEQSIGNYTYKVFTLPYSLNGAENVTISFGYHFPVLTGVTIDHDIYIRICNDLIKEITDPENPEAYNHADEVWTLAGWFNDWRTDDPSCVMTYKDGEFVIRVYFEDYQQFKFVRGGNWDYAHRGISPNTALVLGEDFPIEEPGDNIEIPEGGTYDIYMSADATTARIVKRTEE